MESFVVKKLGGENASEMVKSAQNVITDSRKWVQQAVVISAMRSDSFNTTDKLIQMGEAVKKGDFETVHTLIQAVSDFHRSLIREKTWDITSVYEEAKKVLEAELNAFWSIVRFAMEKWQSPLKEQDYTIKDKDGKNLSIIGFWEILSAKIFSTIINELSKVDSKEVKTSVIDTSNAVWEILNGNAFITLADSLGEKVSQNKEISIVPGYVGRFRAGIENAVGRWYSDATAAALAVGMKSLWTDDVTLEIQKSVRGMLSADPRILQHSEDAQLLPWVNYVLAKEIIWWAKAKLLHDQALRKEVIESGIEIKLFDPFSKESEWTVIWKNKEKDGKKGIQFIGGKESVFFSISSTNLWGPWVLSKVFDIVKKYASVDIHSGSETEVSFSIEAGTASNLAKLQKELQRAFWIEKNSDENFVTYTTGKATIHCVGNLKWVIWLSRKVTQILEDNDINIEMQSQGTQERAIILWIDKKDMKKAVNALHAYFIK